MPFCPICKSEYREGVTACADCGHELVESLPSDPENEYIDDEPAFLASGSSSIECGIIEGSLRTAHIPFLKKDRETGGYMTVYMGYSVFGSDYYVPSKLLSKAKETLDASTVPDAWDASADDTIEDEGTQTSEEQYTISDENEAETNYERPRMSRRTVAIIIIFLWCLLPVAVALIINFIQMFYR